MNADGHEDVAKDVGLGLLEKMFIQASLPKPRLEAFYLGNWLTDVSQTVDPVAYTNVANDIRNAIKGLFGHLKKHIPFDNIDRAADELQKVCESAVNAVLGGPNDPKASSKQSVLSKTFETYFFVKGYYKFVHDNPKKNKWKMDWPSYQVILRGKGKHKARFSQYYPHEHLDRPEVLKSDPTHFESEIASGPRWIKRINSNPPPVKPDQYGYLREDIEMAAGLLTEIDKTWARPEFTGSAKGDADVDWNVSLAKLGHAIHMVEDFFSHSTWIENAIKVFGRRFRFMSRKEKGRYAMIYQRRLKRYVNETQAKSDDISKMHDEKNVVTGYFTTIDTIISIVHLLEHALNWETKGLVGQANDIKDFVNEKQYNQMLTDTLDFLADPKKLLAKPGDNAVAKHLQKEYGDDYTTLTRPLTPRDVSTVMVQEAPLLKDAPPLIQKEFGHVVDAFSKAIVIGKYTLSLYKLIRYIHDFMKKPKKCLKDILIALGVPDWIVNQFLGYMAYYFRRYLLDYMGQTKIGSHSLIAKDHGPEFLYHQQKACTAAVHWYIIWSMTRWARPQRRLVARSAVKDEAKDKPFNKQDTHDWIDWLELLEFYLRHPWQTNEVIEYKTITRPYTMDYTTKRGDSLASLADKFRSNSIFRDKSKYNWAMIADWTWGLSNVKNIKVKKRAINEILSKSNLAYLLRDQVNYAFKAGYKVRIPYQKNTITVPVIKKSLKPKWFYAILTTKNRRGKYGTWEPLQEYYKSGKLCLWKIGSKTFPISMHRWEYLTSKEQLDRQIESAVTLRSVRENKYQP